MITWYRRLAMSQEESRADISALHPRNHPLELEGVSRMNGRLSY